MSAPIENYGMIGDCRTAALVGKNGSVDWLCWPRFDSDACFAALLGGQSNGFWLITPNEAVRAVRRRYRPDTLILETEFETAKGRITLIDFMLPDSPSSDLIRIVRGDAGEVPVCTELMLRFGYGATTPWVTRLEGGAMRAVAGPDMVVLRTPASFRGENFKTMAQFVLAEGQSIPFVLSYGPSHLPVPAPVDPYDSLQKCEKFWRDWTARTKADGIHTEAIKRSLITLKALTFLPSGGIVAAPTTSLPERLGGVRNWDYRLCWLRDATLTLLAMMEADIYDEAAAWRDWLQRAVAGAPAEMQIMYGLRGERRLTEWTADWLPGYADSRPVRIGNAAYQQFQLDVYGELIDVFERSRRRGLAAPEEGWELQRSLVEHVCKVWRNPDNGIWETRGPQRHFVHSKVMAWVALDRGIKSVDTHALEGPVKDWRAIRDDIRNEVLDSGFDKTRNTFRAAYDSDQLDASLLLLAHTGFIDADDPRFVGTVEAIERELLRDGFVMRHNMSEADEGLQPGEGAFLACSFWLADAYMSIGRHADAEALFLRLLAVRNDLGLLAEEYDPHEGRLLGNFPQAFSHIALINTAFRLSRSREAGLKTAKPDSTESAAPADLSRPASSSGSR